MQCEMQSVSSRIWTRVAVSISYDDNHYTTGTSFRAELMVPAQNTYSHTYTQHNHINVKAPIWTYTYIHICIYILMVNLQPYTYVYNREFIHALMHILTPTHMHMHRAKSVYNHTSVNSVTLGHKFTSEGFKFDSSNIKAVVKLSCHNHK